MSSKVPVHGGDDDVLSLCVLITREDYLQYAAQLRREQRRGHLPVSYTHLDVYKRQARGFMALYRVEKLSRGQGSGIDRAEPDRGAVEFGLLRRGSAAGSGDQNRVPPDG